MTRDDGSMGSLFLLFSSRGEGSLTGPGGGRRDGGREGASEGEGSSRA